MIMIKAIIYIFLYYVIFDEQLKITFRKSWGTPEKIHSPLFTYYPPKNSKIGTPPLFANTGNVLWRPCRKGVGRALRGTDRKSSSNPVKSKSINQS